MMSGVRLSKDSPSVILPDPLPSKFVVEPFVSGVPQWAADCTIFFFYTV